MAVYKTPIIGKSPIRWPRQVRIEIRLLSNKIPKHRNPHDQNQAPPIFFPRIDLSNYNSQAFNKADIKPLECIVPRVPVPNPNLGQIILGQFPHHNRTYENRSYTVDI